MVCTGEGGLPSGDAQRRVGHLGMDSTVRITGYPQLVESTSEPSIGEHNTAAHDFEL